MPRHIVVFRRCVPTPWVAATVSSSEPEVRTERRGLEMTGRRRDWTQLILGAWVIVGLVILVLVFARG